MATLPYGHCTSILLLAIFQLSLKVIMNLISNTMCIPFLSYGDLAKSNLEPLLVVKMASSDPHFFLIVARVSAPAF